VASPSAPASPATTPAGCSEAARACKLCLLGDPGVGKTSLVQRVLHAQFPAVAPGPGITVSPHRFGGGEQVVFWDVAGSSAIDTLSQAFLSRVDAVAAVVDAAAAGSDAVERALALIAQARRLYPRTPAALLLNKRDLAVATPLPAVPEDVQAFEVSARDGRGVDAAFLALARAAGLRRATAG
jgi:small GTP-binding protein